MARKRKTPPSPSPTGSSSLPASPPRKTKTPPGGGVHARGGTHRIKDEHRTNTKYDDWNRDELLAELKLRPEIFKKDLKKHVMAQLLADDDRSRMQQEKRKKKEKEKAAAREKKRREEEELAKSVREKEKQRARKQKEEEKEKRRLRREAKLERRRIATEEGVDIRSDEEGSDEHEDSDDMGDISELDFFFSSESEALIGAFGTLLDDDSGWDSQSSGDDSTSTASSKPADAFSLRLFEWINDGCRPLALPYVPMKLITTETREIVTLPGGDVPETESPASVPPLTRWDIECARNGVLVGPLQDAVIESAQDWRQRTQVHQQNGGLWFNTPPRSSNAPPLSEVYTKYRLLKTLRRKLRRSKWADTVEIRREKLRQADRQAEKDRRQKTLEILASSEHRPMIGYAPVWLEAMEDPGARRWNVRFRKGRRVLGLFYVTLAGEQVPRFCFWVRRGEWEDPRRENLAWKAGWKWVDVDVQRQELARMYGDVDCNRHALYIRDGEDPERPLDLDQDTKRVRKTPKPLSKEDRSQKRPLRSRYESTVWRLEKELWREGVRNVLFRYKEQWLAEGKREHWYHLSRFLPGLYVSGQLPKAPPVHLDEDIDAGRVPRSLAEKIASILIPGPSRPLSPIRGDEPWARNDDEGWDIIPLSEWELRRPSLDSSVATPSSSVFTETEKGVATRSEKSATTTGNAKHATTKSILSRRRPTKPLRIVPPRPSQDPERAQPKLRIPSPTRRGRRSSAPTPSPTLLTHSGSFAVSVDGPVVPATEAPPEHDIQHVVPPNTAALPPAEGSSDDDDPADLVLGALVNRIRNVRKRREERREK